MLFKYLLGGPKWDPVVVRHTFLDMGFTWVVRQLHPDFSLGTDENLHHSNNKLPTSLSSRPGGHALFSTGMIVWPSFFVPSVGLEDVVANIKSLLSSPSQP